MDVLVKILSFLPMKLLYVLSGLLYLVVYRLVGYRKKVVRGNLNRVFPKKGKNEILSIEKDFYRNFCDFMLETLKAYRISKSEVMARANFENLDELKEILDHHKSVIFLTSHVFNWEWMHLSAALQFPIPINYVYHPLHGQRSDKLMLELRGRFGAQPIKRREAARQIIKKNAAGHGFAILADQFPPTKDKVAWVQFLDIETAFYHSVEQIARLINQPVLYFHMIKEKRGFYSIKMIPISTAPKEEPEGELTKKYAKAIEENIKEQPALYLWSHKRWKRSRADVEALGK